MEEQDQGVAQIDPTDPVAKAVLSTEPGQKWNLPEDPDQANGVMKEFLRSHAIAGRSYGEAAKNWEQSFPGIDKPSEEDYSSWEKRAPREALLDHARRSAWTETQRGLQNTLVGEAAPFWDFAQKNQYENAKERFDKDEASGTDLGVIANYEKTQALRQQYAQEHEQGFWGKAGRLARAAPGMAAELMAARAPIAGLTSMATPAALAGASGFVPAAARLGIRAGAMAAAVPSMGPQSVYEGAQQDGLAGAARGAAQSYGRAVAMEALFGASGALTSRVGGFTGAGVAGVGGLAAQQGIDAVNYMTGLAPLSGTFQAIKEKKWDEVAAEGVMGVLTNIAMLGAAHGEEAAKGVADQFAKDFQAQKKAGLSDQAAAQKAAASVPEAPPVHATEEIPGEFGQSGRAALQPEPPKAPESPQDAPGAEPTKTSPESVRTPPEQPQSVRPAEPATPPAPPEGQLTTMRQALKSTGAAAYRADGQTKIRGGWENATPEDLMAGVKRLGIGPAVGLGAEPAPPAPDRRASELSLGEPDPNGRVAIRDAGGKDVGGITLLQKEGARPQLLVSADNKLSPRQWAGLLRSAGEKFPAGEAEVIRVGGARDGESRVVYIGKKARGALTGNEKSSDDVLDSLLAHSDALQAISKARPEEVEAAKQAVAAHPTEEQQHAQRELTEAALRLGINPESLGGALQQALRGEHPGDRGAPEAAEPVPGDEPTQAAGAGVPPVPPAAAPEPEAGTLDRDQARAADRAKMAEMGDAKKAREAAARKAEPPGERLNRSNTERRNPQVFADARTAGVDLDELHATARYYLQQAREVEQSESSRNELIDEAYDALKEHGVHRNTILAGRKAGRDADSVRGLDEVAEDLSKRPEFRSFFDLDREHASDTLLDILNQGKSKLTTEADAYDRALGDIVHEQEKRARAEAQRSGFSPRAAEEALRSGRGAGEAEEAAGDASEEGAAGDDGGFDFGANAAEPEQSAARLSSAEQHVVEQRKLGRSFAEIAGDKEVGGGVFSRQRIQQIEAAARKKLGQEQSVEESVIKPRAAEAIDRLRERGKLTSAGDLHATAEEGGRKISQKQSAEERAGEDAGDAYLGAYDRAAKNGLSPEAAKAAAKAAAQKVYDDAGIDLPWGMGAAGVGPGEGAPPDGARGVGVATPEAKEPQKPSGWFRKLGDALASFAQKTFPTLHRIDRETGEKAAQLTNAPQAAKAGWDYFSNILKAGNKRLSDLSPEEDRMLGATWLEMRFRHYREQLLKQGIDPSKVGTLVGQEGSPLKTEADFQEARQGMAPFFEAVRQEWTPEVEKNYRGVRGLEPDEAIDSQSQIPGLPLNAIAIRDGDAATGAVRTGKRVGVQNLNVRAPGFTRKAELSAPAYDTSLSNMMRRTLDLGVPAARKADFVRTAIGNGVMAEVGRGEAPPDGYRELPLKPSAMTGLDPAARYYVKDEAYRDVVRAMALEERPGQAFGEVIKPAVDKLYAVALASPVELATHIGNHMTALFRTGMGVPIANLKESFANFKRVWQREPEMMRRVKELTEIGASFGHEAKPGLLGEKWQQYDPTAYVNKFTSKLIDTMQKAVRVQLEDAYDRTGGLDHTEAGKRDFINQALGNYNAQAGSRLAQFLKDTGLQGFATAAHTFSTQGVKTATGGAINAEAKNMASAVQLRAAAVVKMLPFLAMGPIINSLRHGQAFPQNVPAFAIKTRDDEDGKTHYFDPLAFTGIRRGWRATGQNALIERATQGVKAVPNIPDRMVRDAFRSVEHLFAGPPVQLAHTALTGEDGVGRMVADKAKKGESQTYENVIAALKQANPVVASMLEKERKKGTPLTVIEKMMKSLGPFGEQTRAAPSQSRTR